MYSSCYPHKSRDPIIICSSTLILYSQDPSRIIEDFNKSPSYFLPTLYLKQRKKKKVFKNLNRANYLINRSLPERDSFDDRLLSLISRINYITWLFLRDESESLARYLRGISEQTGALTRKRNKLELRSRGC